MIREGDIAEVLDVIARIPEFKNPYSRSEFEKRLSSKALILVAENEDEIVGFKCGYEQGNESTFYSWMGGIVPEMRGNGIAKSLLERMEQWCKNKGYQYLTFKTLNEHKSMLIFSLKYGFEIIDVTHSDKDDRLRIWLKKELE